MEIRAAAIWDASRQRPSKPLQIRCQERSSHLGECVRRVLVVPPNRVYTFSECATSAAVVGAMPKRAREELCANCRVYCSGLVSTTMNWTRQRGQTVRTFVATGPDWTRRSAQTNRLHWRAARESARLLRSVHTDNREAELCAAQVARVRLTNSIEVTKYIPGIGHNLQDIRIVLMPRADAMKVSGFVSHRAWRNARTQAVLKPQASRSKYGAKTGPKAGAGEVGRG